MGFDFGGAGFAPIYRPPPAPKPPPPKPVEPDNIVTTLGTPGYTGAPTAGAHGEGSNGYVKGLTWANPNNPYAAQATADTNAANQAQQYSQSNIQAMQGQFDKAAGNYPSFPNTFGLGNSQGLGGAQATGPQGPVTQPGNDSGSRGFNPWSLVGEATARGQ